MIATEVEAVHGDASRLEVRSILNSTLDLSLAHSLQQPLLFSLSLSLSRDMRTSDLDTTTNPLDVRLPRTLKTELGVNALNTMSRVQVLDQSDLETGGTTLTTGDSAVSQEVFPDAEPALAILRLDLLTVAEPVAVPAP